MHFLLGPTDGIRSGNGLGFVVPIDEHARMLMDQKPRPDDIVGLTQNERDEVLFRVDLLLQELGDPRAHQRLPTLVERREVGDIGW
jgi:hypothetical protein